jgi:hypothetical protein
MITPFEIVLINMISYMGGIFSGMAMVVKFKNSIRRSNSDRNFVANPMNAPPVLVRGYQTRAHQKEIIIRDQE